MERAKSDRAVCKVRLKNILRENIQYDSLITAIKDANELISIGYLFMRSFILYAIENNIDCPKINVDFIRMSFSVLITDKKSGRPFNTEKTKDLSILSEYFNIFASKTNIGKIETKNISYILGQSYEQIYIAIINNIRYHFDKHVWRFIRASFISEYKTIREEKNSDKLDEYYSVLGKVKNDILNNSLTSPEKYHSWIKINRHLIIPVTYSETKFGADITKNTFSYLKCMCHINKSIQESELKSYQIFPIRTACYANHIKINTSALIDLFYDKLDLKYKNKRECFAIAGDTNFQKSIWNMIFSLKEYKRKGFSFNYEIETDGFAVSLNMINNNEIKNKETKKENFKKKRQVAAKNKKEMSIEEYNNFLQNKQEIKIKNSEETRQNRKELIAKIKAEFKGKSKEEQEKIKDELNDTKEFPYVERILKSETKRAEFKKLYDQGKLLFSDPGKRSPFYFMAPNNTFEEPSNNSVNNFGVSINKKHQLNKNHKFMNYTNATRLMFTKRKKYGRLVEHWKKMHVIGIVEGESNEWVQKSLKDIEVELSKFNQKSCKHDEFIKYVIKKLEYNKKNKYQYDTTYLQKLQWFSYLNRLHHENLLIDKIKSTFGSDIRMIIGDWSNRGNIRYISTPNISLKRKFGDHFKVYSIDEYNTSKKHYKYHENCTNMKVPIKDDKTNVDKSEDTKINNMQPKREFKRLHSVLTYKIVKSDMECNRSISGCINRDKNSVLNMETIVKSLMETGKRHPIFERKANQANRKGKSSDARGALSEVSQPEKQPTELKVTKSVKIKRSHKKIVQKGKTDEKKSDKKSDKNKPKIQKVSKSIN